MNVNTLSLAQTPPLMVPLRYFLTAPLFGMAAAGLLLWGGPAAFTVRWDPLLLGATHLLTLGFLAMAMLGAFQQLLPILAGAGVPRAQAVSRVLHLLLAAGTALLAAGLVGARLLLPWAMAALAGALFGFIAIAALTLRRARSGHATVRAMGLAAAALAVTAALGLQLAAGHAWPGRVALARHLTDLHLAWGLLGWVTLLVMGVAYQVVPMFQMTPDYPRSMVRGLTYALFGLLAGWSAVATWHGPAALRWALALAASGGYLAFAGTTLWLQRRRRRPLPDVTVAYWRTSMVALIGAVALWWLRPLWPGLQGRLELAIGVLLVVGFGMGVICGMLYKIVPFLVWLHLNNRLQVAGRRQGRVPNMRQIIPERLGRRQWWLHLTALAGLLAAALWPGADRPAAVALLAAQALLGWNMMGALRLYRRHLAAAG